MLANQWLRLKPNIATAKDEHENITQRTETTCKSSFQSPRKRTRDPITEEDWELQAWTLALNDEATNSHQREELGSDAKLSDETDVPLDAFVTWYDMITVIADEMKKKTGAIAMKSITGAVEDTVKEVIQVEYTSAKEAIQCSSASHWKTLLSMFSSRVRWTHFGFVALV